MNEIVSLSEGTVAFPSELPLSMALVGAGLLAQKIRDHARSVAQIIVSDEWSTRIEAPGSERGLLVLASDTADVENMRAANRWCHEHGVRFLPVWIEFGEGRVGPLILPERGPCLECVEQRRLLNNPHGDYYELALRKQSEKPQPILIESSVDLLAELAVLELRRSIRPNRKANRIITLNLANLECTTHNVTADPRCLVCGSIPDDSRNLVMVALCRGHKIRNNWRVHDLSRVRHQLSNHFVDARTGLATTVGIDISTPLCAVGSARFACSEMHREDWGAGLTFSFEKSQSVAILETLERYAGLRARGKRTRTKSTYRDLRSEAVDPRSLVLYSDDQFKHPLFPCVPFGDDLECTWVWAYSFKRKRPVLVPEQCVYYDAFQYPRESRFVVESSSGCAIGGCLEEAVLYGLLEVLERDAALRTWYTRSSPPKFEHRNLGRRLRLAIDRIGDVFGYEVVILDITQEFRIPSVWVVAVKPDDTVHRALCTTKAHVDVEVAISGALGELMGTLLYHRQQALSRRVELLGMAANSDKVRDRLHHSLLAGLPETFDRLSFLFDNPRHSCTPINKSVPETGFGLDVADVADELVNRIVGAGYDVLVIDQTSPEQRRFKLRTARVIVPGLLPMTYCNFMYRLEGARGLEGIRCVNKFPHPFA